MKHYVEVQKDSSKWVQVNWFTNLNHAIQDAKNTHLNPDNPASKGVTAARVVTGRRKPFIQFFRESNFGKNEKVWRGFTPEMKRVFRRFFRPGAVSKKRIPGATFGALKRRNLIIENRGQTAIIPNYAGCELMDYLRDSKQVTKDRSL